MAKTESHALRTMAEVMAALGGDHQVSALTGAPYKVVENWKREKRFPSRYFLVMTTALHRRRLSASAELWGMVTPQERRDALEALVARSKGRLAEGRRRPS